MPKIMVKSKIKKLTLNTKTQDVGRIGFKLCMWYKLEKSSRDIIFPLKVFQFGAYMWELWICKVVGLITWSKLKIFKNPSQESYENLPF